MLHLNKEGPARRPTPVGQVGFLVPYVDAFVRDLLENVVLQARAQIQSQPNGGLARFVAEGPRQLDACGEAQAVARAVHVKGKIAGVKTVAGPQAGPRRSTNGTHPTVPAHCCCGMGLKTKQRRGFQHRPHPSVVGRRGEVKMPRRALRGDRFGLGESHRQKNALEKGGHPVPAAPETQGLHRSRATRLSG